MLSQERRSQLDGIVLQMSKQNAPQEDVQAVVSDFKRKYESEQVSGTQFSSTPVQDEWSQKSESEKFSAGPTEVIKGAAKGVLSTLDSMAQIGQDVLKEKVADPIFEGITGINVPEQKNAQLPKELTEATNTFQKIGKGVEQIGEFFIPAGLTAKLAKISDSGIMMTKLATEYGTQGEKAARALSFLTRSGILAGEGAGVTKIQTYGEEDSDEQAKINAIISGAIPITAKLFSGVVKPVLKVTGEKIENALIKPSQKDIKDGFNIENLSKYDVGGSLEQISQKTHNKIEQLSAQLNEVIQSRPERIDLNSVIDAVESEMTKGGTRTFGMNTKLGNALKFFREEVGAITQDGNVSIADAQQIKRAVGKLGAWQYGARDPESTAVETVANNLYTKLKNEIEATSPVEIRDINKQLSELIPIENAVIRRIPIADRNNMISLTDVLTAAPGLVHPSNLWLFFLNRLSKSGTIGNALIKVGKKVEDGKGAVNELLYGPNKNTILTPGEQNAAGKVKTVIDGMKSKGGMTIRKVSNQEAGDIEYQIREKIADGRFDDAKELFQLLPKNNQYRKGMESFFNQKKVSGIPKKNDNNESHIFDGLVTNIQSGNKGTKITDLNPIDFNSFKDTVSTKEGRATVDYLKEKILNGERPTIDVKVGKNGKVFVEDGHHTVQAYKELGFENIPTNKLKGFAKIPTLIGGLGVTGAATIASANGKKSLDGKSFTQKTKEKDIYVTERRIPPQEDIKKKETVIKNNIKENKDIIRQVAKEEGFDDVNLLLRMAEAESSFNRFAVNSYVEKGKKYFVHGPFQISDIHGLSKEDRQDVRKATKWAIDKIRKGGISAWKSSESKWKK